jgi:tRNA threonylcarbamoyladenosine biosynthesis protein TsaE
MRRTTSTAEETEAFGAELASARPRGGALQVIALGGDLGAGKTTLARGFLWGSGVAGAVRSPTYTLVETYGVGSTTFVHLDLYRLSEPSELENLGLRDWATAGHVWLVEWPERGAGLLPAADLSVQLVAADRHHVIEVEARSAAGAAWLAAVEIAAART